MTATRAVFSQGASRTGNDYSLLLNSTGTVTSEALNASVWAKSNTGVAQTVYLAIGGQQVAAVSVGSVWQRISGTLTSTTARLDIGVRATGGDPSLDILIWGAQLEAASTAGPYIATTSAQVTRAAQMATVNDLTKLRFNAAQGTIYVEWGATNRVPASVAHTNTVLYNSLDRFNQRIYGEGDSSGNLLYHMATPGNNVLISPPAPASVVRDAVAFNAAAFSASRNGSVTATTAANGVPAGINTLGIGNLQGSYQFNTPIKRIRLYPRALSNTELQALTA
jgi:hypothetical protein